MARLTHPFRTTEGESSALQKLRRRFDLFRELLDRNNQVLQIIGDMEEKAQGEYLFDLTYVRTILEQLRDAVHATVDLLIDLGGPEYQVLKDRANAIESQIALLLPGTHPVEPGPMVLPFSRIDSRDTFLVGSKNAQLGEMKRLGLNVPEGFAVTAYGYRCFLEENGLQQEIDALLEGLDIQNHDDLVAVCDRLKVIFEKSQVPGDLASGIRDQHDELLSRRGAGRVALRSSAIGEDSLFSFAGQYSSFLNVPPDQLLKRYRDILASKFSPRALFYLLSHSIGEQELAMSVGCIEMVDAMVSGVMYTRDPIDPDADTVLVHAIYGLGPYLVEGEVSPDVFKLCRERAGVVESTIRTKARRLVLDPEGGVKEEPVPEADRDVPCVDERTLQSLVDIAARLEDHYGHAQDIEWAVDRATGRVVVLQARPLRLLCDLPVSERVDLDGLKVLASGGTTVCPGAGGGPVAVIQSADQVGEIERGSVVVAPNPFPALAQVLDRASALVTEIGGSASHLASLAREKRVPTLVGIPKLLDRMVPGDVVTVDATGMSIYAGMQDELIQNRRPEYDLFEDTAIYDLLRRLLEIISPLNLVSPTEPDFRPDRCVTFHDITRFAHQRGIEEVFHLAREVGRQRDAGAMLDTVLPLPVHVLDLESVLPDGTQTWSKERDIPEGPFRSFWSGMLKEGWPGHLPNPNRFIPVSASHGGNLHSTQFTENSFAVIGRDYALVSLRLGFHFTSVEAMGCDEPEKNFVRLHYKGGGAAADRRQRRIRLLAELLSRMGFEHIVKSDFIDSVMTFRPREEILETLARLGRLTLMTKQLDMALSNDRVTGWYREDFAKRLGLASERVFPL
ncbi:hypothetical protein KQI63_04985 [bacterium]|nr:hypothetical protein [bacterium]